jgi:hypothetical protein
MSSIPRIRACYTNIYNGWVLYRIEKQTEADASIDWSRGGHGDTQI